MMRPHQQLTVINRPPGDFMASDKNYAIINNPRYVKY